jgi:hypothetical protein
MCNLYSITTNQAAIIFRVINRYVGDLLPIPQTRRTPETMNLWRARFPTMTWRYLILILILGEALVGGVLLWYRQRIAQRKGSH